MRVTRRVLVLTSHMPKYIPRCAGALERYSLALIDRALLHSIVWVPVLLNATVKMPKGQSILQCKAQLQELWRRILQSRSQTPTPRTAMTSSIHSMPTWQCVHRTRQKKQRWRGYNMLSFLDSRSDRGWRVSTKSISLSQSRNSVWVDLERRSRNRREDLEGGVESRYSGVKTFLRHVHVQGNSFSSETCPFQSETHQKHAHFKRAKIQIGMPYFAKLGEMPKLWIVQIWPRSDECPHCLKRF